MLLILLVLNVKIEHEILFKLQDFPSFNYNEKKIVQTTYGNILENDSLRVQDIEEYQDYCYTKKVPEYEIENNIDEITKTNNFSNFIDPSGFL